MAYVHISVHDLRPGMYIVQTGESWENHPYLYAKPGLIANEKEIEEIKRQGFLETFFDPDKSQTNSGRYETIADVNDARTPEPPKVQLQDEIANLQKPYENFVSHMEDVLEQTGDGLTDISSSCFIVQDIIQSMDRNRDALICLSKLRSFDSYTYAHCVNVGILGIGFATHLGLPAGDLEMVGLAGLFHDVGKMKVPPTILNAPRKLTAEEFHIMQRHPRVGAEILASVPGVSKGIVDGVLDHHERNDGKGYPNKKKGPQISTFGKIISLADVYDALTTKRPYKDSLAPNRALAIMYDMREDAWEGIMLEHFIKMIGIYPVGTPVVLTGGFKGVVTQSNPVAPLYPSVMLCLDKNGRYLRKPEWIDLSQQHDIQIVKAINPHSFPVDISFLLIEGRIKAA